MNMWIAKLHKFSRKFVGWITAAGPIIAYVLSIFTIVVGVIIYATKIWPDAPVYWVAAGSIGMLFSLLVERLTLTQAAKVRTAREKREDIQTSYAQVPNPTPQTEVNKQRALATVKTGGAGWLVLAGVIISTCAGTLFWHYLLQALPEWQAWGFSTLFSALISFTLVSSELHRHLENEVVSGSIQADHFTDLAGHEDARDRVIERFASQHGTALETALGHQTVSEIADYQAQQTLDDVLKGQGQIPMHIQRERAARRMATEQERILTEQQMEIVHQAQPKDEKPRGLIGHIVDVFKSPDTDDHTAEVQPSPNGKVPHF